MRKRPKQPPKRQTLPKTRRFSVHFLKEHRRHKGLTQEQLAERVGTDRSNIAHIEGRKTQLTQEMLDRLAVALQTSRGKILDEPPR